MTQACPKMASAVANQSVLADWPPWGETQSPRLAYRHCMRAPRQNVQGAQHLWSQYIEEQLSTCTAKGLGRALHAVQDCYAPGHNFQEWAGGMPSQEHLEGDIDPPKSALRDATNASIGIIERFKKMCKCECE